MPFILSVTPVELKMVSSEFIILTAIILNMMLLTKIQIFFVLVNVVILKQYQRGEKNKNSIRFTMRTSCLFCPDRKRTKLFSSIRKRLRRNKTMVAIVSSRCLSLGCDDIFDLQKSLFFLFVRMSSNISILKPINNTKVCG